MEKNIRSEILGIRGNVEDVRCQIDLIKTMAEMIECGVCENIRHACVPDAYKEYVASFSDDLSKLISITYHLIYEAEQDTDAIIKRLNKAAEVVA